MRLLALPLALALLAGCGSDDAPPVDLEPDVEAVEAPGPPDPGMAPGTDDPEPADDAAAPDDAEPVYDEMAYRIVRAEAGDRACYLDLEPESGGGVETYEASFEVCDQIEDGGLTGRLVTYTMETVSVMAASCEGDMDCPDRDEVEAIMTIDLVD